MCAKFAGFPEDTFSFLNELVNNNSREWFEPQKERYEGSVREPALEFIAAMSEPLAELAPHFQAIPKKVGGSLMRPYRDIRFSPDKTPYKTNIGIQFRHEAGKDVHAPGYYVHVEPDGCFVGVGLWKPDSVPLKDIRQSIVDSPDEYRSILTNSRFKKLFTLGGESLKRPPKGFDPEHPLIDELKRKDFIASHDVPFDLITTAKFLPSVAASFEIAAPWVRFLCGALGLEY